MLPHSLPELTPAAPRDSALKCRGGGRRGVHVSVAPPNLERCGEHGGGRGPVHWPLSTAPPHGPRHRHCHIPGGRGKRPHRPELTAAARLPHGDVGGHGPTPAAPCRQAGILQAPLPSILSTEAHQACVSSALKAAEPFPWFHQRNTRRAYLAKQPGHSPHVHSGTGHHAA